MTNSGVVADPSSAVPALRKFGDVEFLVARFHEASDAPALAWRGTTVSYAELAAQIDRDVDWLTAQGGIGPGVPVALVGDYSFRSISLLLALMATGAIVVPLAPATRATLGPLLDDDVAPQLILDVTEVVSLSDSPLVERRESGASNPYYETLVERGTCGLVLFTSGSTGRPKAVVHDFSRLLDKFRRPRPALVTLNFLLFDHWGGLNTLLGCLASQTLVVFPEKRTPHEICGLIEQHKIALLPATPTFLNMLLISRAFDRFDLSSLKLITYGAETMPEATLKGLRSVFPDVELRQTYGMIELGVMRAKSRGSDSLWVKLGGEGYDLRVVDGVLQVKAETAMLGYLNAPSPFTDDGYLITGDMVEQDGEYLKILGRKSDIINVGGQKVYPAEVETVLLELPEIKDAVVYGEQSVLTGKIVVADLMLSDEAAIEPAALRQKVKRHCASKLQSFMIPVRINISQDSFYTARLKKRRDQA